MKDLEKIKSEDLAAQVQDANPGNFAIEQEVAAMVGATVPAPTEPSADDARELGAQLLVFLRRALLPIRSALRTAVAAIYAHLDSRCTDYTPAAYAPYQHLPSYDPMRPFVPRTLPNLLTALTAFAPRKISNGSAPSDGIPDGMSLAHLLCDTSAANSVTEIVDDNYGWTMDKNSLSLLPNANKIKLRCKNLSFNRGYYTTPLISGSYTEIDMSDTEDIAITGGNRSAVMVYANMDDLTTLRIDKLKRMDGGLVSNCDALTELEAPSLKEIGTTFAAGCENLERAVADDLERVNGYANVPALIANNPKLKYASFKSLNYYYIYGAGTGGGSLQNMPLLEELHIGKSPFINGSAWYCAALSGCGSLIKLVIYGDLNQNLYLNSWNPTDKGTTFLQNFREHIALRLTANGSGKTLTLSQAVRDAIHAAEATYGIEAIIVAQKGWRIQPDAS